MKKLLLVLAIGSFVACNDGGSAEAEKTADSTVITPSADSTVITPSTDSTVITPATDSLKKDTVIKK